MLSLKSFFVGTTRGIDIINIGHDLRGLIREARLENGLVTITFRERGAALAILAGGKELEEARKGFESIPVEMRRFLPAALSLPVEKGKISFEPWQEIYLVDYDPAGRRREVVVQLLSEPEVKGGKGA